MSEQDTIAVIGAGVIGAAVSLSLAREGRRVLLLDRAEPGIAGASFGNVGHIAAELVQPLPSPGLLFGFWRELFAFGGALDLPARQVLSMLPWIRRFAASAFRRAENTRQLAPLVLPAAAAWALWLKEISRPELLRRHGHYEIGFGRHSAQQMRATARAMTELGIKTREVSAEQLLPLQRAANATAAAGLWFEDSAHVIDPLRVVQALVAAALARNATYRRAEVRALRVSGDKLELHSDLPLLRIDAAVVCAGMGSAPLLAPFGLHAPVVYTREHLLVTPMAGRLRASSYMEFSAADAPPDPRKPERLRRTARALGYPFDLEGPSWVGARPVLPDYLPGIGRAPGARIFYALGHQHIGLTIAPITAELIADLVAERAPRHAISDFNLTRFGAPANTLTH
jgi:glycine/D-amino acid oxidase-like deaminating enzyme